MEAFLHPPRRYRKIEASRQPFVASLTQSQPTMMPLFSSLTATHLLQSPAIVSAANAPFSALITGPDWWDRTKAVQHIGEATFTAAFLIAFLQAFVAILQYRTNPAGELVVPPGPTIGTESPNRTVLYDEDNHRKSSSFASLKEKFEQENYQSERVITSSTSRYARILNRCNRFLFLLLPWVFEKASYLMGMQMHVMHIGFIVGMVRIFDVPTTFFERQQQNSIALPDAAAVCASEKVERVLVIGDSLAVGLGTVNQFDKNKNQTVDYCLLENLMILIF